MAQQNDKNGLRSSASSVITSAVTHLSSLFWRHLDSQGAIISLSRLEDAKKQWKCAQNVFSLFSANRVHNSLKDQYLAKQKGSAWLEFFSAKMSVFNKTFLLFLKQNIISRGKRRKQQWRKLTRNNLTDGEVAVTSALTQHWPWESRLCLCFLKLTFVSLRRNWAD